MLSAVVKQIGRLNRDWGMGRSTIKLLTKNLDGLVYRCEDVPKDLSMIFKFSEISQRKSITGES